MHAKVFQLSPRGSWRGDEPDSNLDSPRTLVLVFGPSAAITAPASVTDVVAKFPHAVIMGCSTAGEIVGDTVVSDSVTVAVATFTHTRLQAASAELAGAVDSYRAGHDLGTTLVADDLVSVLVLAPGLDVNGSELVRGLTETLPPQVVVTGGLAGDADRFAQTWVLADGVLNDQMATAVGFYGDRLVVGHGSRGGWEIFGPERRVTRSEYNVVYEIDHRPALALYRQYLGELAAGLPGTGLHFPLAVRESLDADRQLVRTVLAIDEDAQSMTFAGDIPQGWWAQLMRASAEQLIDGAEAAAELATSTMNLDSVAAGDSSDVPASSDTPGETLAIAISCVGRRMVLGQDTDEEVEATLDMLPAGTVQVGFYSYGELSPYDTGRCELHNQSMTLTTLRET